MKTYVVDRKLYIENRKKLAKNLKPGSMAVVISNDMMPTNSDGLIKYRPNSDLFWLTGVEQEESILVLFPDAPDPNLKEVLFLRETSELIAIWEGKKLSKEEAKERTGIQNIVWLSDFNKIFRNLITDADYVYINSNEHKRAVIEVETRAARFIKWCKEQYPLHNYQRLSPIINRLRAVKSKEELDLMQKACDITEKAFRRVLKFVKPGVMEYEVEAEFIHEYIRNGGDNADYSPIIASGRSSCVLHYVENNKECRDGDVLLIDTGASFRYYNADMSRTIPVNGRFTKRQKAVYTAVLNVMKSSISSVVKGTVWKDLQRETEENMERELLKLKLLKMSDIKKQDPNWPAFKKYFMHGVSHFLGIDVHDVGYFHEPFKPGMVFTVEPGIYILEEGIGIRLENNIVVKEKGNFDLMRNIPLEIEEIEEIMNSK
ncbi:MAG TPA: aminopeptidase P family protein [Ignavibacteria bacterium]|nr:aminopeptidase P family protein [Ignavibacteria bacterium]